RRRRDCAPPRCPRRRRGRNGVPRADAGAARPVGNGPGARAGAAAGARWDERGEGDRARADARRRVRGAGARGMTRAFLSGMRIHLVQFARNPFDLSGVVLWPILYASIAYYLLDAKKDPRLLLSASLGAAVMLMWSLVVIGSSNALEQQRWQGTLELL